jgi:predicted aspartyl protease
MHTFRLALVSATALTVAILSFSAPAITQEAPAAPPPAATIAPSTPSLDDALRLMRSGNLDGSAQEYSALTSGPTAAMAYVGLARVYLRERRPDDAYAAANKAVELSPHLPDAQVALGEVYFRQGRLHDGEVQFVNVINSQANNARAFLGLARISNAGSLYRRGKEMIDKAYALDPADPDIRRYWLARLSVSDRIQALQEILAHYSGDDAGRAALNRQLDLLFQASPSSARQCRMVSNTPSMQTKLRELLIDANHLRGYGLDVKINGVGSQLMLDTGAGGILIDRKLAEKAGVKQIVQTTVRGIGDQGPAAAFVGKADSIRIGELEFDDCNVEVLDRNSVVGEDGLIGGNVFANFLVDINLPDTKFTLSPLPLRPDEPAPPPSLEADPNAVSGFHDRYVAPEMQSYTRVFRFGHLLLLPTKLNDSVSKLFVIDTGAITSSISPQAAREVTHVSDDSTTHVRGLNGNVKEVSRGEELTLEFGNFRQRNLDIIAFDTKSQSDSVGTEISGTLGFTVLRMLDMKIDYRDGLVLFTYDPNRWRSLPQ